MMKDFRDRLDPGPLSNVPPAGSASRRALLPVVSLGTAVLQGWELLPKAVEVVEVQGGERVSVAVGALGEHRTPRVDDDGPSVGPSSVGFPPPLGRSYDIGLVLYGPRPQQKLPVVLARLEREGGRDSESLGAAQREQSVELGEAYVVADREPDGRVARLRG